jgi:hypothetical protein
LFRTAVQYPPDLATWDRSFKDPLTMLGEALDDCVAVGAIPAHRRSGAEELSWIAVHGLATLATEGMVASSGPGFDWLLAHTLNMVAAGVGCDPALVEPWWPLEARTRA